MTIQSLSRQLLTSLKKVGPRELLYFVGFIVFLTVLFLIVRRFPVQPVVEAIRGMGTLPFFTGMALLPVIGFPVTPFYLLAGATFGIWTSLAGTAISQAINLVLAYWLARRYLRGVIQKLVKRWRDEIPQVQPKNHVNFTILVKITPGPPNFIKSFILGLARIPFAIFFIVSWPTTMGYAIGVIIFGDSLVDGNIWQAVGGFGLMVLFLIIVKMVANAYSRKKNSRDEAAGLS